VNILPAGAGPAAPAKPGPASPLADKEQWIAAKYMEKKALARPSAASTPERLQQWLWEAVQQGDLKAGECGWASGGAGGSSPSLFNTLCCSRGPAGHQCIRGAAPPAASSRLFATLL
jgi:hypothetical protein